MNWLKKGPELKLPSLKRGGGKGRDLTPPTFLADLYYDMRDRRLLPLIGLVVVAIVAVPFLMGSDPEPLPPPVAEAPDEGVARASELTVVEATPGLRDYRKRLGERSAVDPFVQQYTAPIGGGGDTEGGGSGEASTSPGSTDVEGSAEGGGASPDSSGAGQGGGSGGAGSPGEVDPDDSGLRFFAYRPDVLFGVAGSGKLTSYEQLPAGQLLPKRNPVVVFVGASEDGKRAAFDVAPEVAMVKGPGRCIGGAQNCSLLMLKAGQVAELVTATPGRSFRLKVEKIEFVEVERPAPEEKDSKPAGASAAGGRGWGFDLSQSFSK